jgi:hypothetical protein
VLKRVIFSPLVGSIASTMFRVVEILLSLINSFASGVHRVKRDVPARFIMQSFPFTESCQAPASVGSPSTMDIPPGSISPAFSDRLSTVMVCPSPISLETRCLPTKPVPPVMKILIKNFPPFNLSRGFICGRTGLSD